MLLSICSASTASEASKRVRRRMASMALKRPVETSQARGLAGILFRPLGHGGGEGVVQRLLGPVEVAEEADERGEDAPRFVAVEVVDGLANLFGGGFVHRRHALGLQR
ncbi:MAG: hypothetical protein U0232_26010 [Thermomicrobiales bacterium]